MSSVYYWDYRIEIRPCAIPDGWSALTHIWSCQAGMTRMTALTLPPHLAFATAKQAQVHAEEVARQWVDEQEHTKT